MRIKSKATKVEQYLTKDSWESMPRHRQRFYDVIDDSDSLIPSVEVKEIKRETPRDVFEADLEKDEIQKIIDECTRQDIKDALDEQGIEYRENMKHLELAEIYYKWKKTNY